MVGSTGHRYVGIQDNFSLAVVFVCNVYILECIEYIYLSLVPFVNFPTVGKYSLKLGAHYGGSN